MDALKRFNRHIASGNAGAALSKFVSKKDGSAIVPLDAVNGQPKWFRIHSDKHGYNFYYHVASEETHVGSRDGEALPWGVEIPPEQYANRDRNAEAVAGTGHTWSSHDQMADLLGARTKYMERPEISAENPEDLAARREAQVAELVAQTQRMADRIKLSQAGESAAYIQIGDPEHPDPNVRSGSWRIQEPNEYSDSAPWGYALAHTSRLGTYHRPGLDEFGPQMTEGEERPTKPAKDLVGSLAFNAMVNVPGMRHATIMEGQATPQADGTWVDDSYGDGSQVHYRVDPTPIKEGIPKYKVLGFDVVVPHLIGAKDEEGNPVAQEHTYRRNQSLRVDQGGNVHVTHMSHMMAMTGPDGQEYVSDPVEHEVGERSDHNKEDTGMVRDSLAMEVAKARGEFDWYDEQQRQLDGISNRILHGEYATEPTEKGGLRAKYRKDGGLASWMGRIISGPPVMRKMLLDQVRGHMGGDLPEEYQSFVNDPASVAPEVIDRMVGTIGFARAQQQIVPVIETKDRLLAKYGEQIHPDIFGKDAKGFTFDNQIEKGTPHHQNYVTNEYSRMQGMARQLVGNPGKWGEAVEIAHDFLREHIKAFPTEPGPEGGKNWFSGIRNSVRAKAGIKYNVYGIAKTAEEEEPEEEEQSSGRSWEELPHDTPIQHVIGGSFIVRHRTQGKDVVTPHQLNEDEHGDVFQAETIGQLHTALGNITKENPGGGGRKGVSPKWAKLSVLLPGQAQPTTVRMSPQKGTQTKRFLVDPGDASRQSAVSWAVYHPPTHTVSKGTRGIVATFPSQSQAVAHAQMLQEQGAEPGHVLIPLHKNTRLPIDDARPPDDLPPSAHPQQVHGKTIRQIPWGTGGEQYHDAGILAIRQSRDAHAQAALREGGPMALVARRFFPDVSMARSFTRTPVDEAGRVPTKPAFSPVK